MKKTRKILLLLTVVSLALSLCACGSGNSTNPTPTDPAPTGSAPTTATTDPVAASEAKTGVVIEASMNSFVIVASDGSTYYFVTDDDTKFEDDGAGLGDTVSVEYLGEYAKDVTATMVKVVEKASEGTVSAVPELTTSQTTPTEADSIKYITAVVKNAAMNGMTVEWSRNGKEYFVVLDDNTTVNGSIVLDETVRIYHHGDLADNMTALRVDVMSEAPEVINFISGTVVDVSMNTITVECESTQYNLSKNDDTKSDDVVVGDTVRVYFCGNLQSGVVATRIAKR